MIPVTRRVKPSRRTFCAMLGAGLAAPFVVRTRGAFAASAAMFKTDGLEQMAEAMRGHVQRGEASGIVTLLARGDAVEVGAYGTLGFDTGASMARDTIFRTASVGKPLTAAGAMALVDDGKVGLDDPVDKWLPELADRKVLKSFDGPLTDTVPADRPITLRDLLTLRFGLGAIMVWPPKYPIQLAMQEAGFLPGPLLTQLPADEFIKSMGELPLAHQPGEQWLYHTGMDVAGVFIERVSGKNLGAYMQERIFAPLGMKDTGFFVPPEKIDRLATFYAPDPASGKLTVMDEPRNGMWSKPPVLETGGGGYVSTADDLLAFSRMMLAGGALTGARVLEAESVAEIVRDQLTAEQKARSHFVPGFWDTRGWGLGTCIMTAPDEYAPTPGRFGWDGGYGPSWYADPATGLTGILLVQRLLMSPEPEPIWKDFWTHAFKAVA